VTARARRAVLGQARAARGRTLIELVIAMALGLLMLAVLGGIYLSARQGTRSVDQNAQLQDAGRFALAAVGRELRQAGWAPILDPTSAVLAQPRLYERAPPVTPIDACRAGYSNPTDVTTPTCAGGATGAPTDPPDAFTVRYAPDAGSIEGAVDCAGNAIAGPAVVVNRFYVAANSSSTDAARRELKCAGAGANTVTFLDNVEAMRLFVGLDTNNATGKDFKGVADTWSLPSAVSAAQFLNYAVALRVCLLVVSPEAGITTTQFTYTDCDNQLIAPTDGRMRRAFWGTFGLRNNLPSFFTTN
jgi:type IV pilus assembly protein PilW